MFSACFEETTYEKERRRRIEENEQVLKQLFPQLNSGFRGKGLLVSPSKVKSPTLRRQSRSQTKQTRLSLPIRKNPGRACRRKGDDSSQSSSDSFSESDNGSSPPALVVKWPGRLTEGITIKKRPSIEHLKTSPPKSRKSCIAKLAVEDITEEELSLVAVRTSDKHYDSEVGTTCHQCRQKTADLKTICRSDNCFGVRGQFCGPCLWNRYGEDAKVAILDRDWECPPCRGICNCSFCMKKRGKRATGILIHTARELGYQDVKTFLGD